MLRLLLTSTALLIAVTAQAEVTVTWLGPAADGSFASAFAVSADGSTVAGTSGNKFFIWTRETGMRLIDVEPAFAWCALSGDGRVLVGNTNTGHEAGQPFRWTEAGGVEYFANSLAESETASALCLTGGGSFAGGYINDNFIGGNGYRAVTWSSTGNVNTYQSLAGVGGVVASLSANGSVAAGHSMASVGPPYGYRDRAVVWRNGIITNLGVLPGHDLSHAWAVSADGSTVIGESSGPNGSIGFTWTVNDGIRPMQQIPDQQYVVPHALSADGTVGIADATDLHGGYGAYYYTRETGPIELGKYLVTLDPSREGLAEQFIAPYGISASGTTIVGYGDRGNGAEPFIVELDKDSDLDGLPDDWEINGVPYLDAQGVPQRYLLDTNGDGISDANPLRKDLFVEADAMLSFAPYDNTIPENVEVFDRAPVPAVPGLQGGLPGISLHVQLDELDLPLRDYPNRWVEFNQDKAQRFGTLADRTHTDWAARRKARAKVFRYCIFARKLDNNETIGTAEIGGNDFIIAMEPYLHPTQGTPPSLELKLIAESATFMHEFGHTLGLRHGGADNRNFKANYFSVMNYQFNVANQINLTFYSRYFPNYSFEALADLDEVSLDESLGVSLGLPDAWFIHSIDRGEPVCNSPVCNDSPSCTISSFYDGQVDWINDCTYQSGPLTRSVNINNCGTTNAPGIELLVSHNDWQNILYSFLGSPDAADGAIPREQVEEIQMDELRALAAVPPPPSCMTLTVDAPSAACSSGDTTLVAEANAGGAPITYSWQALTPRGKFIRNLQDGQFLDDRTGLTYTVSGAQTAALNISGIALGSHPSSIKLAVVVSSPCGPASSPTIVLNICAADFNCDSVVDFFDYLDFVSAFADGTLAADFNKDGTTDFFDYLDFVQAFSVGC